MARIDGQCLLCETIFVPSDILGFSLCRERTEKTKSQNSRITFRPPRHIVLFCGVDGEDSEKSTT